MTTDNPDNHHCESTGANDEVSRRRALEKLATYSALAGPVLTVLLKPREGQASSGPPVGDSV